MSFEPRKKNCSVGHVNDIRSETAAVTRQLISRGIDERAWNTYWNLQTKSSSDEVCDKRLNAARFESKRRLLCDQSNHDRTLFLLSKPPAQVATDISIELNAVWQFLVYIQHETSWTNCARLSKTISRRHYATTKGSLSASLQRDSCSILQSSLSP